MQLMDLFNAAAISAYWEELASNSLPYLGETLFPSKRMQGIKLDWIKGADKLPVMLQPCAFDAQPKLRDRGGVDAVNMKMPFFRESMRISEDDRQQLLTLSAAGSQYAQPLIEKLFDDASGLIDSARVNPEVMRFELMQNGTITIASTNADSGQDVKYAYNYDPDGTWTANNIIQVGTAWSTSTAANPVNMAGDILAAKRAASAKGTTITRAVCGSKIWGEMLTCEAVVKAIHPLAGTADVTDSELHRYLADTLGVAFSVYDKMYTDYTGADKAYMEEDKIILLPASEVGYTYYGTTPEEADLMGAAADENIRIVNGGVAVGTKRTSLPVNVVTWASEIVLPSFERMSSVFVLKTEA